MTYQGPNKFELLVLITKYNLASPNDKIKPEITQGVGDRESIKVNEFLTQEATRRARYPYNSFQRQAQRLQPLLENVLRLTNFDSYNKLDWMELLIAVNDMLKLVREKMQETRQRNNERMQKDMERKKAEYAAEKLRRAQKEQKKADEMRVDKEEAEKAQQLATDETAKGRPTPERRPNKLQKKPNPLVYPNQANKGKDKKIQNPDKEPTSPAPPNEHNVESAESTTEAHADTGASVPGKCPYPMDSSMTNNPEAEIPLDPASIKEPEQAQIPGYFPASPVPIPTGNETASAGETKPTTPPTRPALQKRSRSKDDPKKRVSFDGTETKVDRPKAEDAVMIEEDMSGTTPDAPKGDSLEVLSIIQPETGLIEEKLPKRKKGREPERHQEKMEKAHYDALRVASEIKKFSWPGVGRL